jgi:hypothetical protein
MFLSNDAWSTEMWKISADINYTNGTLEGMVIKNGWSITEPSREAADQLKNLLEEWKLQVKPVRSFSGAFYVIVGNIKVEEVSAK